MIASRIAFAWAAIRCPQNRSRRYRAGIRSFFNQYERLASTWRVYDNSGDVPRLIAARLDFHEIDVYDGDLWATIVQQGARDELKPSNIWTAYSSKRGTS